MTNSPSRTVVARRTVVALLLVLIAVLAPQQSLSASPHTVSSIVYAYDASVVGRADVYAIDAFDLYASPQGTRSLERSASPLGSTRSMPTTPLTVGVAPETEGAVASSMTSATGLARQLAGEEASSIFTESGELQPSVIQESHEIIPGSEIGNSEVIKSLTANGGNIADWGKFTTPTFESPSGPFQVHFYYNPVTGAADYSMDYKAVFNNGYQPW